MGNDQDSGIILKKQLAQLLRERSLSAAELSRRAGVPKQTISDWLGGVPPRNIAAVRRLAQTLGTSIENLVFGESLDSLASSAESAVNVEMKPTHILGTELAIVTEQGLIKYASPAWDAMLGMDHTHYSGRPLYEFIHIDDISTLREGQESGQNYFRLVDLKGKTHRILHQGLALGRSQITFHHLMPMPEQKQEAPVAKEILDISEVFQKLKEIMQQAPYADHASPLWETEHDPIQLCAVRPLLGTLLLRLIYDMTVAQRNAKSPELAPNLSIEGGANHRDFWIRLRIDKQISWSAEKTIQQNLSQAEACGIGLRALHGPTEQGVELYGVRLFLSAAASY